MSDLGIREAIDPAEMSEHLQNRMQEFVSSLLVISSMTKRGGVLADEYREREFPAIRRMAIRLLDALEKGEPVRHPWDI